jgi:tagatose 1,6-diphosphate aldolase
VTDLAFQFLSPGVLRDQELELVAPHLQYVDLFLDASHHPLTRAQMPREAAINRQQIIETLEAWPIGQQPSDRNRGSIPTYHFWMKVDLPGEPESIAGAIGLRIGGNHDTYMYYGHIGYHVYPQHRGHHYAERSCRLLLPLAKRHGLKTLWITCNPENAPSRRTCERLGATFVEIVNVPPGHPLQLRGEHQKCRFRVDL